MKSFGLTKMQTDGHHVCVAWQNPVGMVLFDVTGRQVVDLVAQGKVVLIKQQLE
jgi:hypothetical protein